MTVFTSFGHSGFGAGFFGSTEFGASSSGPFSLAYAVAYTSRDVLVGFTGAPGSVPLFVSPIGQGDASNTQTWTVINNLSSSLVPIVAVAQFTPTNPTPDPTISYLLVRSFLPWVPYATYTIQAPGVLDENYNPIPSGLATSATFTGLPLGSPVPGPLQNTNNAYDVQNTQNSSQISGSLFVDSSGDYALQTGYEQLKKLIYRRLTTPLGAFRQLPNYGVNFSLKVPYPAGSLFTLKSEIEKQVQLEPEVQTASAAISISAQGVLLVQLQVKLKQSSQTVSFQFPFPRNG